MASPNFPSTGLVPNETKFTVGALTYLWDGEKWRTITAKLSADQITYDSSENVKEAIDRNSEYMALKIFQSPTDGGLTEVQTRTVDAGEVYRVRKTSDDSLATIYSDATGTTEIVQNGTSNVSDSAGVVEFYIADGDYYVEVDSVKGGLLVSRLEPFLTVADMTNATYLSKYAEGTRIEWQGYYAQSDGGSNWGVLKFGAHTDDGGSIFSIDANTYIEANLKGKSLNVKKFGTVGDGVANDTLNLMNAFAYFHTGKLILRGDFLIDYDTDNPWFPIYMPSGAVGANICRSLCFFGLKNAVIDGEGARIIVKKNAKTVRDYDATFGAIMSFGEVLNVKFKGLTIEGNGFDQPFPGEYNSMYMPRNHGISFFKGAGDIVGDFKGVSVSGCTFRELGWYDTRAMNTGDNAGDAVLTFGIPSIENFNISDCDFIDVGRWGVAIDIYDDGTDTYRNITVSGNRMYNIRNTTSGFTNGTRNLGFFDLEVTTNIDGVLVDNNTVVDGRGAISIGGGSHTVTDDVFLKNIKIINNNVNITGVHKWYILALGTSVNGPKRIIDSLVFSGNKYIIENQNFTTWPFGKVELVNFTANNNTLIAGNSGTSGIGFQLGDGRSTCSGTVLMSNNTISGFEESFHFTQTDYISSGVTVKLVGNNIIKCKKPYAIRLSSECVDYRVTADKNIITSDCGYSTLSAHPNSTLTGPEIIIDDVDQDRDVLGTVGPVCNGNVIIKSNRLSVNFESQAMPYFGSFEKGTKVMRFQDPWVSGNRVGLICKESGQTISSLRGDAAWSTGESLTDGGFYGSPHRYNNGNMYVLITAGTTGSTAPTHTIGDVSDGGVTWRYVGKVASFVKYGIVD